MRYILQTPQILQPSLPSLLSDHQHHISNSLPRLSCRLSRRDLSIVASTLPLLLPTLSLSSQAQAETSETSAQDTIVSNSDEEPIVSYCTNQLVTKKAFLDISIDGEPAGRIVVGLYEKTSSYGASRFAKLISGAAGISYRRKEFVKIVPNYVQHGGVRSYGVDVELTSRSGTKLAADKLVSEWESICEKCRGQTMCVAGSVGLVIRDPNKPPPKSKLVARGGKLQVEEEQVGKDPNGTEFVIAIKDSPELDESTLVIGRVVEGMDVVDKISNVKTVKENTSSPYFRIAKLVGDNRAVVAERGFNRPYSKVTVSNCGLID